jgi:hypothetical protein
LRAFAQARQKQAEAEVQRTWSSDQIFLIERQMQKVSRLADGPAN